ncbi:MAG: hypothetical protein A2992_00905 [Elusimicrobia bacterium RIFCSPLOWO2_01_FULL_59_12]|nr:MAG: hypothetical protein A2992_00905 [Elusimicrobia bacterium RIFCSPLOWO2_01_FULL_59_12]
MGALFEKNSSGEKPQIARDLEGLDPKEGTISRGLRGTFTVRHYVSGPWAGGTAIIELASDLSYAEIRIFDFEGSLQRIYSVQPNAQKGRLDPSSVNNPLAMVQQASPPSAVSGQSDAMNVVRSREREAAVAAQTAQAVKAGQEERAAERSAPQGRAGTVSNKAGSIVEGSTLAAIEAAESERMSPKRRLVRVRRKRPRKTPKNALDTPLSGPGSQYEYYYEDVVVVDKPAQPDDPAASEKPVQTAAAAPEPPAAKTSPEPVQVASSRMSPSVTPRGGSLPAPSASSAYDEAGLPDVTQAVQENQTESAASRSRRRQRETVAEDIREAQKAAARLDSDQWTPKSGAAAPLSDAELGLVPLEGSGSSPARRARRRTQEDEMVPMSEEVRRGGRVTEGSEAWSPSATAPKLSAKEQQTLAMLNNLKQVAPVPVVKVNRDVNNPEEGVKPFYSLEKFSGPQYGRHREFERRVIYKQNRKSAVKGYEFYIDEVDRKQEKHYLYYYKVDPKTKKAKLIATEKHEQVAFLSNYDIGSEDKGKIDYE